MNSNDGSGSSKLWLIGIAILILLTCCVFSIGAAAVLYAKSDGIALKDLVPNPLQGQPRSEATQAIPPVLEEVPDPLGQPVQEETIPPMQAEDFLLAITPSGIWQIDEPTQAVLQISTDDLDGPRPYRSGLSPNKKYYAYTTGGIHPTLVVFDLQINSRVVETPLSGPNSQIKPDMNASDPGQSVLLAMQAFGSMAWSPDGTLLAFAAAMDHSNTDLYLLDTADLSIKRLSDENSNASGIHWSPDGRFIEFVTVNNFGTGAGMDMDAVWVYDRSRSETRLLEQSTSAGEVFIAWIDGESFYMHSWSAICSNYHLRKINAVTGSQQVILESCFSSAAYDPDGQLGIVAVSDMFVDACPCGDVDDYGTYSFGESLGLGDVGILTKKFEYINAYSVELLESGNLFAVYTEEGLSHLFDHTGYPISIPEAVKGLEPYPSPSGQYWVWYPYYGDEAGLWVTDQQNNAIEVPAVSTGNLIWREGGNGFYFIESNRIVYAGAPDFTPSVFAELPVREIYAIGK